MPNPYFSFKKFTIHQDNCAMKVGTDGCLLGAWATAKNHKFILDVGAGTGLISTMLAQRFASARVCGIEIEKACANQCKENFSNSPFAERLMMENCAFQNFQSNHKFDLLVSNPPYFSNAFSPENNARKAARHDDSLSPDALFFHAEKWMAEKGKMCIIIPTDREPAFCEAAAKSGLHTEERCAVHTTPTKPAKRVLLKFGRTKTSIQQNKLVIEISRGNYSEDFTKLLRDFYLHL